MKRLNFNIKDRKVLYMILCVVIVCVFTLTIAYAALNAVFIIQGNAQVSSANWDIHFANPVVTNGSITTTKPIINGNSLTFDVTLNMPGDFYEFNVDIVNSGTIDAKLENIIITPELDSVQSKYFSFLFEYANGNSINVGDDIDKNSTVTTTFKVLYRNDLNASDLPNQITSFNVNVTLEFVQDDSSTSTGGFDNYNEIYPGVYASGDVTVPGTIVRIGNEEFYTIEVEDGNLKLFAMYNLYVGNKCIGSTCTAYGDEATGLQDSSMIGYDDSTGMSYGTIAFSGAKYVGYDESILKSYVDNYANHIRTFGVDVIEARLIYEDELVTAGCGDDWTCVDGPLWTYSTSYWIGLSGMVGGYYNIVDRSGDIEEMRTTKDSIAGVRPVIVIDIGL